MQGGGEGGVGAESTGPHGGATHKDLSSGPKPCRVSSLMTPMASTRARCSLAPPRSSLASSGCQGSSLCSAPRANSEWWWKR